MHEDIVNKWLGIIDAAVEMKDGSRVGFTSGQIEEALIELQLGDDTNPDRQNGPLSYLKRAIIQDGHKTLGLEPLPEGQGEDERVVARRVGLWVLVDDMYMTSTKLEQGNDIECVQYELSRRLFEQNRLNRFTTEADPLKSDMDILREQSAEGGTWANFNDELVHFVDGDDEEAWIKSPEQLQGVLNDLVKRDPLSAKAKALLEYEKTQIEPTRAAWAKRQGDMEAHKAAMKAAYEANVKKVEELENGAQHETAAYAYANQEVARCAMDGGVEAPVARLQAIAGAYQKVVPLAAKLGMTDVLQNVADRLGVLETSELYREMGTLLRVQVNKGLGNSASGQLGEHTDVPSLGRTEIPQTGAPGNLGSK